MTERTCGTCAWWTREKGPGGGATKKGLCHQNTFQVTVPYGYWCRHWSETTGWDRFEKDPERLPYQTSEQTHAQKALVQAAYEIISTVEKYDDNCLDRSIQQWLEEYKRQC